MKTTLTLTWASLVLTMTVACSTPPTQRYRPISVQPVRTSVMAVQTNVARAQVHAKSASDRIHLLIKALDKQTPELRDLAAGVSTDIDQLTQELLQAQANGNLAQARVTELEGDYKAQAATMDQIAQERDKLLAQVGALKRKYHKLLGALCLVIGVLVGLLVWKFKALLVAFGPWGWAGMIAAPILASTAAWFLLDRLL